MIENFDRKIGFKLKVTLILWFVFALLTLLVVLGLTRPLDAYVILSVSELNAQFNTVFRAVSFIASAPIMFLIAFIILVYKLTMGARVEREFALFLSLFLVSVLTVVMKYAVAIPRPSDVSYLLFPLKYSYPSGHASRFTIFCYYLGRRRWEQVLLIILLFLVSMSRILLLQHYLSDVLGGILLGLATSVSVEVSSVYWLKYLTRLLRVS